MEVRTAWQDRDVNRGHSTPMRSHAAAPGACTFQRSRQETVSGCPTKAALARVW